MFSRPVNFRNLSTAFFLCLLSTSSNADDLFDMLKRMSDADQKQNYQGTFILRKSDNLSTLKVTHGVDDKGVWETLEALNGESRKVYRHNNLVISVFPARELVTIRHHSKKQSLHQQLPDNIDQLEQFYTMERLADDRIANHQTLVVDLLPRDQFRYGYRYWVDKNTGMLLRCDLLDEKKVVVEQMMFTSLDYLTEVPAQTFELQDFSQYEQKNLDEQEVETSDQADTRGWKVSHLPKGFMLTQSTVRHLNSPADKQASSADNTQDSTPTDLLHLVYSDGLASVSVFIEANRGGTSHLQGSASMGAVNAFGKAHDGYFTTVVGEVPAKTVQLIAQSMVKPSR
jgi:sigma-E factor negative regulatory protein RseB